jgi:hypothetical protein
MTRLAPLSFAAHGSLGWTPTVSSVVPGQGAAVALCMDELPGFALRLPLAIQLQRGRARPVVPVRGVRAGGLPLLDEAGTWRARIVPFALRRGPFQAVRTADTETVFVDETALLPPGGAVVPLFDGPGTLAAATRDHLAALAGWQAGLAWAERAAGALHAARLLRPCRGGDDPFLRPDPEAVARLEGGALAQLHRVGALRLAHVIELSQGLVEATPAPGPDPAARPADDADAFLRAFREEMS